MDPSHRRRLLPADLAADASRAVRAIGAAHAQRFVGDAAFAYDVLLQSLAPASESRDAKTRRRVVVMMLLVAQERAIE